MYFKQDGSLVYSSLIFFLISHATSGKYIWISWLVEWMKCMSNLTLFTQIVVSFFVDKKYNCPSLTDS